MTYFRDKQTSTGRNVDFLLKSIAAGENHDRIQRVKTLVGKYIGEVEKVAAMNAEISRCRTSGLEPPPPRPAT